MTTIVSRKNKTSGKTMGTDSSSMSKTRRWMGTSDNESSIIEKNNGIGANDIESQLSSKQKRKLTRQ